MSEGTITDKDALERLGELDSCAISDALDTLGLKGATIGVQPLWPVETLVVGRARTVQAGPRQADRPADHIAAAAIEASGQGDVLVIANDGRIDVSCFGGILTLAASRRGVAGVVIDGACRDIAESEELGFAVFGRAVVPVSARGRIVQLSMNETVQFAGVTVGPSDLVIADRNGVAFIPQEHTETVLDLAERIVAREAGMAAAVQDGQPVTEVMHDSRFPSATEVAK